MAAEILDGDGNVVAVCHQTSLLMPPRRKESPPAQPDRVLATVMFTDIRGSTEQVERLGDARWRKLLDEHHRLVRRQLALFKGREVKTTGDGFLALFDSPGRAVQAARATRDAVRPLGLEVRVGLHTGECEVSGADVAGIARSTSRRVSNRWPNRSRHDRRRGQVGINFWPFRNSSAISCIGKGSGRGSPATLLRWGNAAASF